MKALLYILTSLFILGPFFMWVVVRMKMPNEFPSQENSSFIYHDFFISIGSFTSSPKTFAFISMAIGFILLAYITHLDFKNTHSSEVIDEVTENQDN